MIPKPLFLALAGVVTTAVLAVTIASFQQTTIGSQLRASVAQTSSEDTEPDNEPALPPIVRFTGTIQNIATDGTITVRSRRGTTYAVRPGSDAQIVDVRGRVMERSKLAVGHRVRVRGRVDGPIPFLANRLRDFSVLPSPSPRPSPTPRPTPSTRPSATPTENPTPAPLVNGWVSGTVERVDGPRIIVRSGVAVGDNQRTIDVGRMRVVVTPSTTIFDDTETRRTITVNDIRSNDRLSANGLYSTSDSTLEQTTTVSIIRRR